MHPLGLMILTALGAAASWPAFFWIAGHLDGWRALAAHYRIPRPTSPPDHRFVTLGLSVMAWYRSSMHLAFTPQGITIAPFIVFRPGHPPLHIPWEELICARPVQIWATDALEIRTRAAPDVPLILPHALFDAYEHQLPLHTPCTAAVPLGWKVLGLISGVGVCMLLGMYLVFLV
jgi:hypothetical protein